MRIIERLKALGASDGPVASEVRAQLGSMGYIEGWQPEQGDWEELSFDTVETPYEPQDPLGEDSALGPTQAPLDDPEPPEEDDPTF
jgi:hypothetical protein